MGSGVTVLLCLQKARLASDQVSQPQLNDSAGKLATCQPEEIRYSAAVAEQPPAQSDVALGDSDTSQPPKQGSKCWCADAECPNHKRFDGYKNWRSLRRHIKKQHEDNADALLAIAVSTGRVRYWCPEPGCSKSAVLTTALKVACPPKA